MFHNIILKTSYYFLPSIFRALSFLVIIPLTTFYFNPQDLGLFYVLNSVLLVLGPLSNIGIEWAFQSNYYKLNKIKIKIFFFNAVLIDFFLRIFWSVIVFIIFSNFGHYLLENFDSSYNFYLILILISFIINFLWISLSQVLILEKKAKDFSIIESSRVLIFIIVLVILLVVLDLGFISLFLSPLLTNLIIFFIELIYVKKLIKVKIDKKILLSIFKFGLPVLPTSLIDMSQGFFDKLIIQKFLGFYLTGIYGHSQSYFSMFLQSARAVGRVISPLLIKNITKKNLNNVDKLNETNVLIFKISLFLGLFVIFLSEYFISIFTFNKFTESAVLVNIWYSSLFIIYFSNTVLSVLIVKKLTKFIMHSSVYITVCIFILLFYFAKYMSIEQIVYILVFKRFIVVIIRYYKAQDFINRNYLFKFIQYFLIYLAITYLNSEISINIFIKIGLIVISGIDCFIDFNKKNKIINYLQKNV